MKKMKSVLCVLLAVMLMLSLTACVRNPDATTVPQSPTTTVPPVTSTPEGLKVDLDKNWTIGIASSGPFSEVGYYYFSDYFLSFMDTENGTSVILCSKAGCQHDKAEDWDEIYACEAFIDGGTFLFYSDGYLYYNKIEQDNPNAIHLYRRNADGTAEKKVATLCEAYFSQTASVEIAGYISADGILYYSASIYEIVQTEPGAFVDTRTEVLLMRLDLTTGKEKEILRLKNAYIMPLAAREDALIFHRFDALPQNEMKDFEKRKNLPTLLQVWTKSNGTADTIFETTYEKCSLIGMYGDKFYYSGRNEYAGIYAYDFATGEHISTNLPENAVIVNENYWSVYDQEEFKTTIYDFRTGEPVSGDFADWRINFRIVGKKGGIVELALITGITPDGKKLIVEKKIEGYIPFAALEDGLQKEDILIMYEEEYSN